MCSCCIYISLLVYFVVLCVLVVSTLYCADLLKVKEEVLPLSARWKSFGLALGLHPDVLNRIECDHKKVDDCLQAVLQEWLNTVETLRGPPSWDLLVSAVANPAGGNYQALAKEIAERHNGRVQVTW